MTLMQTNGRNGTNENRFGEPDQVRQGVYTLRSVLARAPETPMIVVSTCEYEAVAIRAVCDSLSDHQKGRIAAILDSGRHVLSVVNQTLDTAAAASTPAATNSPAPGLDFGAPAG